MRIALAQFNPTIGDVEGNVALIVERVRAARAERSDIVLFPEQAIIGYPAKDLLLRRELIAANVAALDRIAVETRDIAVVVGFAEPVDKPRGRPLYNAVALLLGGRIVARRRKRLLPTYDIFDELRYFEPGGPDAPIDLLGRRVGLTICEDMWSEQSGLFARPIYSCDPVAELAAAGADLILNLSASPFDVGKFDERHAIMSGHSKRLRIPLVYVNQVGGNDELIFDGSSCAFDAEGRLVARARSFDEDLLLVDLDRPAAARIEPAPAAVASIHDALVMGLRDYTRKCGFRSAVVGLSGGIDSALVAALAAAALGPEQVHGIAMPSRYSSEHSVTDARLLARNLGIRFSIIEIEPMHAAIEGALRPAFEGRPPDVTEENVQARIRGLTLMAVSNKFGTILLTTGNKSELAVGYCTLYGDMCGGLAVISDVPKTIVYALARHVNAKAGWTVIPEGSLTKPPSAELRPNQTDQDTLPPYDVLDAILERYEERLETIDEIVAAGFDAAVVRDVVRKISRSEYKRQQAAPGLKVTSRAFGFGRRMPIAARDVS